MIHMLQSVQLKKLYTVSNILPYLHIEYMNDFSTYNINTSDTRNERMFIQIRYPSAECHILMSIIGITYQCIHVFHSLMRIVLSFFKHFNLQK